VPRTETWHAGQSSWTTWSFVQVYSSGSRRGFREPPSQARHCGRRPAGNPTREVRIAANSAFFSCVQCCWQAPSQCSAQILHKKKKPNKSTEASNTAEPDKQLYNKAMDDIKRGKQEVGRLSLQTLINTYRTASTWRKRNSPLRILLQGRREPPTSRKPSPATRDFIVFFRSCRKRLMPRCRSPWPHNEMPKADRDNDHARLAEEEFQTFLQRYPKDSARSAGPAAPSRGPGNPRGRAIPDCLLLYVKGDRRAAAGRLSPLTRRYPLYSKSDTALWMLADLFEKSERKDLAGVYYGQIVRNYPSRSTPLMPKVS